MKFGFDERTVLAPQMAQLSLQGQRRPSVTKAKGRRLAPALFGDAADPRYFAVASSNRR